MENAWGICRQWCIDVVKKMHGKDGKEKALHGKDGKEADVTHVYDDVTKFRTGTAHCHIHNAKCKLLAAHLGVQLQGFEQSESKSQVDEVFTGGLEQQQPRQDSRHSSRHGQRHRADDAGGFRA